MNRNRGLLTRWSEKDEKPPALRHLAAGLMPFKRANRAALVAA
jgi:hypothetical protein